MVKETLTFNDLPQVVAELRDEVVGMKVVLLDLQKGQTKQKMERVRRTMNVEEAADYLRMPLNTLYMKLQKGEVPGSKPGKRWVLFNDELDKWLEVKRKNAVPLTTEEENDAILSSVSGFCTGYSVCVYNVYTVHSIYNGYNVCNVYVVCNEDKVYRVFNEYSVYRKYNVYSVQTVFTIYKVYKVDNDYNEYKKYNKIFVI